MQFFKKNKKKDEHAVTPAALQAAEDALRFAREETEKERSQNVHLNSYIQTLVKENEELQRKYSDIKVSLDQNKALFEEFMANAQQQQSARVKEPTHRSMASWVSDRGGEPACCSCKQEFAERHKDLIDQIESL